MLPEVKQRNLKDFFLKYTQPIEVPADVKRTPSPFAAFCAKPPRPRRAPTPPQEIAVISEQTITKTAPMTAEPAKQQEIKGTGLKVDIVANDETGISHIHRIISKDDQQRRDKNSPTHTKMSTPPGGARTVTRSRTPSPHTERGSKRPRIEDHDTQKQMNTEVATPITVRRIKPISPEVSHEDAHLDNDQDDMPVPSPTELSQRLSTNNSAPSADIASPLQQYDGIADVAMNLSPGSPAYSSNATSRKRSRGDSSDALDVINYRASKSPRPNPPPVQPQMSAEEGSPPDPPSVPPQVPGDEGATPDLMGDHVEADEMDIPPQDQPQSPPPEPSSHLSSLASRSPTPPPKASQPPASQPPASQALSFITSTQGSRRVVQSSQSDENEEPEGDLTMLEDDDDVESASDSDSSVEDITTILAKFSKPKQPAVQPIKAESGLGANARSLRSQTESGQPTPTPSSFASFESFAPPKTPVYQFSLANLVKQHQRESSIKLEVDEAKEALCARKNPTPSTTSNLHHDVMNEELLMETVKQEDGDEAQVDKLKYALGRADVFLLNPVWYFLEDDAHSVNTKPPTFPSVDCESSLAVLEDPIFREQAFLAKLAPDILASSTVPDSVIDWLWHAGLWESRRNLANAYIEALKTLHSRSNSRIEQFYLEFAFEDMKLSSAARRPEEAIMPAQRFRKGSAHECPRRLIHVVKTIGILSNSLSAGAKQHALEVLLRLGADELIHKHGDMLLTFHDTITSLVESFSEDNVDTVIADVTKSLFKAISNSTLQNRLISAIPSLSPRTHTLKRKLALAFALKDDQVLSPSYSLTEPDLIVPWIARTTYSQARSSTEGTLTDFRAMAAELSLIDVGIDCGFASQLHQYLSHISNPPNPTTQAAKDIKAAEAQFNAEVDLLIKPVRTLSRSIIDAGASHIAKTDAKAVVEALLERLQFAVRTKRKPKMSFFDDTPESKGNVKLMDQYFIKKKDGDSDAVGVGDAVVDGK